MIDYINNCSLNFSKCKFSIYKLHADCIYDYHHYLGDIWRMDSKEFHQSKTNSNNWPNCFVHVEELTFHGLMIAFFLFFNLNNHKINGLFLRSLAQIIWKIPNLLHMKVENCAMMRHFKTSLLHMLHAITANVQLGQMLDYTSVNYMKNKTKFFLSWIVIQFNHR